MNESIIMSKIYCFLYFILLQNYTMDINQVENHSDDTIQYEVIAYSELLCSLRKNQFIELFQGTRKNFIAFMGSTILYYLEKPIILLPFELYEKLEKKDIQLFNAELFEYICVYKKIEEFPFPNVGYPIKFLKCLNKKQLNNLGNALLYNRDNFSCLQLQHWIA